jgi:hypothetical protein
MRRIRRGIIAVCITLGALLLALGDVRRALGDPVAVVLPLPVRGMSAAEVFTLGRGGRFQVAIVTPAASADRVRMSREGSPVRCDIRVVITGKAVRATQIIRAVEALDWTRYTNTWVSNGEVRLPAYGDYVASVSTLSADDPVFSRGGYVRLDRIEANGVDLLPLALDSIGYGLLILALVVALTGSGNA